MSKKPSALYVHPTEWYTEIFSGKYITVSVERLRDDDLVYVPEKSVEEALSLARAEGARMLYEKTCDMMSMRTTHEALAIVEELEAKARTSSGESGAGSGS